MNQTYHVYKVFNSKEKILICSYATRNEARRLEKFLLNSDLRKDWIPEIFTEKGKHTEDCLDANDDTSVLKGKCICPVAEGGK